MKTRNLTTKHALENELKELRVTKITSIIRCDSMSLDQLTQHGGIEQEQAY